MRTVLRTLWILCAFSALASGLAAGSANVATAAAFSPLVAPPPELVDLLAGLAPETSSATEPPANLGLDAYLLIRQLAPGGPWFFAPPDLRIPVSNFTVAGQMSFTMPPIPIFWEMRWESLDGSVYYGSAYVQANPSNSSWTVWVFEGTFTYFSFGLEQIIYSYLNCGLPNPFGSSLPVGSYRHRILQNGVTVLQQPFYVIDDPACPDPPPAPQALSPVGCVNTLRPTLSWGASQNADGYRVSVRKVADGVIVASSDQTSRTYQIPSGRLTANEDYVWSVRAYNEVGESPESNRLTFTPLCAAPPPPQAASPSGCIETVEPVLAWSSVDTATSYRVEVREASGGQLRLNQTVEGTSTSVPPNTLVSATTYVWDVRSKSSHGESGPSNTLTFTPFCGRPDPPQALSPSGCFESTTPTLSWTAIAGAQQYEVSIVDATSNQEVYRQLTTGTSQFISAGWLTANRSYRWSVRAKNSFGDSDWSNTLELIAQCGPPSERPALFEPKNCLPIAQPTFAWSSVPRGEVYQLYVLESSTSRIVVNELLSETSYTPPGPLAAGVEHHWHVKAGNTLNGQLRFGPTSESWHFTPQCDETPEEPSERPDEPQQGPCPAPASVGHPVNVTTGNMYLDQLDLTVTGLGSLAFSRSYNSANREAGRFGVFGAGWTHPFESHLDVNYNVITLRQPNGAVLYFKDELEDGTFEPLVPATEQSSLVRLAGGSFERRHRFGGKQTFDAAGRLTAIVDSMGNTTTVSRDATGKIRTVVEPGGRALSFTYTGQLLTGAAAPGNLVTVAYGYDAEQRLATVTYGDGSGYRFTYDGPSGPMLTVATLAGEILESHTYYPDGRAKTSAISQGREKLELVYEPLRTTVTDALGHATVYDYEELNGSLRVVRIAGPCASCASSGSEVETWTYDEDGRVASRDRGNGAITTYEYDPATGDLLFERDPLLNTTLYTYDEAGRIATVSGPEGTRSAFTYGPAGPTRVATALDAHTIAVVTTEYTPKGQPSRMVDARGAATLHRYEPNGDLRELEDADGNVTRFTYDAMGRRKTATDARGQVTVTDYDLRGRVKKVSYPDGSFLEFGYDAAGRTSTVTDSLGRQSRKAYDGFGRLRFAVDPLGGVTAYEVDLMSRPTSLRDAQGNSTRFERDAYGRITRTVAADGAVEAFEYDRLGRMVEETDRRGVTTTYLYDPAGRLLEKRYSDGTPAVSYAYDAAGRMTRAASSVDTLTWTHDLGGRQLSEASSRHGLTLGFTYDEGGMRRSIAFNGATFASYEYDSLGRLVRLERGGRAFDLTYDEVSRRTSMTAPNGAVTRYVYDQMGRLLELSTERAAVSLTSFLYDYDLAGNRTLLDTPTRTEWYAYDALDRLIEASRFGWGQRFEYDEAGNRTSVETNGAAQSFFYPTANRLASRSPGGAALVSGMVDEDATVTVNGLPSLALSERRFEGSVQAVPGSNLLTVEANDLHGNKTTRTYEFSVPGAPADYDYDANGNLVRRTDEPGHVWTYTWDAENRLTRALRDGVEIARFAYDPLGRRVEKVAGGATTSYVYDGIDVVRELRTAGGTTTTRVYLHGPGVDEPLAHIEAGDWTYYHADGLGSIVATSDHEGELNSNRRFDAWGNLESGSGESGYAFTGREWDAETGLYFYRARYYDPRLGRFISEDPSRAESNAYAYADNNPSSRVDPLGLWSFHIHWWMTYESARKAGASDQQAHLLAFKVAWVDARSGSQSDPAKTIWHAMSNPGEQVSNAQFKAFVQSALQKGDLPLVLHAIQDRYAPSHFGYQEWAGGCPSVRHLLTDSIPYDLVAVALSLNESLAAIQEYQRLHPPAASPAPAPPRCLANPSLNGCYGAF